MSPSFQLLDEPWIPVETTSGEFLEVGLLDAFVRAPDLVRIAHPSPLVTLALYRLLFAIFHRAVPISDVNDWDDEWDEGSAHDRVPPYLERWRHRFDLFDIEAPFWQVPDLSPELGTMSWAKLAAELNDNNNKVLFDHTSTKTDRPLAPPAEIARLLVACQMLSVGAGNSPVGYNVNAVLATSLLVVPEGENLRDTLLVNARPGSNPNDLPVWEQPVPNAASIAKANFSKPPLTFPYVGLANRLTWLTRAIKILPPDETGLVSSIVFGAGLRPEVPEGDRDPWVAYRVSSEGKWVPQRLDTNRAVWRDLGAISVRTDPEKHEAAAVLRSLGSIHDNDRPFPASWTLLIGGQAADKAKIEGWGQERWRLPDVALRDERVEQALVKGIDEAEKTAKDLGRLLWRLARDLLTIDEDRKPDENAVRGVVASFPAMSMFWSSLEKAFARFLTDLATPDADVQHVVDKAIANWHTAIGDAVAIAERATHRSLGRDARALRAWAKTGPRISGLSASSRRLAGRQEGIRA